MSKQKKTEKNFLKLPAFPGGKKAFNDFVKENMVYPEEALANSIEGDVQITYEVTDNGEVLNPKIKHGIGYGCDEEALRLVSILKFGKTHNRGVRVRSRFTTRIPFRLPKKKAPSVINYHISKPQEPKKEEQPAPKAGYTWQVPIKPKQ